MRESTRRGRGLYKAELTDLELNQLYRLELARHEKLLGKKYFHQGVGRDFSILGEGGSVFSDRTASFFRLDLCFIYQL